jgi:hypothetical protein
MLQFDVSSSPLAPRQDAKEHQHPNTSRFGSPSHDKRLTAITSVIGTFMPLFYAIAGWLAKPGDVISLRLPFAFLRVDECFYEKVIKVKGPTWRPSLFFSPTSRQAPKWRGELSRAPVFGVHLDP